MATEETTNPPADNESSSYESVTEEEEAEKCPANVEPAVEPPPGLHKDWAGREASDDDFEREHRRRAARSPTPLHPGAMPKSAPRAGYEPYSREGYEASKGRKGWGKGKEKPKCRYCWKEITYHESGQAQHTYWSVPCLQWQFKLAGFPPQDSLRLAEELKERRMAKYDARALVVAPCLSHLRSM